MPWAWLDGSKWNYSNWETQQDPHDEDEDNIRKDCVAMNQKGKWKLLDCPMVEAFVCQKSIDERSEKMESDSKTTLLAILISLIVACIFIVAIIYWKTKKRCQKIATRFFFIS